MKKIILIIMLLIIAVSGYPDFKNIFKNTDNNNDKPKIETKTETVNGHRTVVIDEKSVKNVGTLYLPFTTLGMWDYDPAKNNPAPEYLTSSVHEKMVKMTGFMYPLETGDKINMFCLLRSTQTCCYGPKPQYNQYVLVRMKEKVAFERNNPVIINGVFYIDPNPKDGYIYRMEGHALSIISNALSKDELPPPAEKAKYETLPEFNISEIEKFLYANKDKELSQINPAKNPILNKYINSELRIHGFFAGVLSETDGVILIGKYFWDGCCQGVPPNITNAVPIKIASGQKLPQLWDSQITYAARCFFNNDRNSWNKKGILYFENAVRIK